MRLHYLLACVAAGTLTGCRSKAELPYLGRWEGRFSVESVDPKLSIRSTARNTLRGFLQLYRTDNRCTLHLEGEQEAVDAKGHWEVKRREIVATFTGRLGDEIKIDDAGGFDLRDPNKVFIPATDLKAAFGAPIALHTASEDQALWSPLVKLGPLSGHFEFKKETLGH
jgi:hypothetical protein